MQIKKGKINNINKKLLAGALVFTLLTTGLTGCKSINDVKYKKDEQGQIQGIEGTLSYDYVSKLNFYEVKNKITGEEYYTIGSDFFIDDNSYAGKYDIFTKQQIGRGNIFTVEYIGKVRDYLVAYNIVKDNYNEKDLREILNLFVENQTKEKQKVKEK